VATLFVPVERAEGLVPVIAGDAPWISPRFRGGERRPVTPLYSLRNATTFPDRVEVGFGGLEAVIQRLLPLRGAPEREEILRRIRFNHPGIDVFALRLGTVLDLRSPQPRAPDRRELLASPIVRRAIEDAWKDSQPFDPDARHEEGGWIYMNTKTGEVFAHRALNGVSASIDLSVPTLFVDAVIVGTFHTHPHPLEERYELGPSRSDEEMDESRGVPGIVRSHAGYHAYGPERRLSLEGHTGFFPGTAERPLD
jgi:hypothetical protein